MSKFTRKVFKVIAELWPTRQGKTLYSKAIYERLVAQGIIPQDGELNESLTYLRDEGHIRMVQSWGEIQMHGNVDITWIDEALFADYLESSPA